MLTLEDLGEDICLLLLSLCDIETVLATSRVNGLFRRLALSKQLWILLVEDLAHRALVDLPHTRALADNTVEELIALVKRTVVGPATWSSPDVSPTLAEEISLPDTFLDAENIILLPGGRYVVEIRDNRVSLWNVKAWRPLWTTDREMHSVRSFEMLDGGRFVTLCLTATRSLKIIQVDLKTGETQALSTTKLSNLFWLDSGPFAISGDLVAHSIRWRTPSSWSARFGGILLINWQEQTYVLISRPCPDVFSNLVPEVVLCPGHMIFTVEHQHATALVFAIADLTSHWRPISSLNFNDVVYWRSIVPAAVARFDDLRIADDREGPGVDTLKLMLYRSPLSHGGYKLFISHSDTLPDIPNWTMGFQKFPSALLAYRLTVSPATGVLEGWERTSAIHAGLPIHYGSYAGYVVERVPEGDAMNIVDLRHPTPGSAANRFIMETDGRFHAAAVSGYSHAVLQRRDSTLVVSYYI